MSLESDVPRIDPCGTPNITSAILELQFKMAASQYIFVEAILYIYFLSSITNANLQFMKQHQCDRCAKAVYNFFLAKKRA